MTVSKKLVMITGPPGAGKSTTAAAVAAKFQPVAEVYTDEIRHRIQPYELPWIEPEGKKQLRLGIESACAVARIYLNNGFNVVMNDVLTLEPHEQYKDLLTEYGGVTVLLMPPLAAVLKRNASREKNIPEARIRLLYSEFNPDDFDIVIDNSEISVTDVVDCIFNFIDFK